MADYDRSLVRNFSVIAHIDHGKSTLSDRFIQMCGGLSEREMTAQVLDNMDIERERGITIKAQAVTLKYKAKDGKTYELNFIDTPGHVDFSYEVSRSLFACEGALLVVDATQGVEAQTLANCYQAVDLDLEVIPVLNKIDLPSADPDKVAAEIEDLIGIEAHDACRCSAKTGVGVGDVLERIVHSIPAPGGSPDAPLQALIIDSYFDDYLGVVALVRVKNGTLRRGDKIRVMSRGDTWQVERLGISTPKRDYNAFREALEKLSLNDASLFFEPENSKALGFGFRCGFLGMLHMEIIQERLEREYNLDLITTAPTVIYEVVETNGDIVHIDSPAALPPVSNIAEIREPIAECRMLTPSDYVGPIMQLCLEKRGIQTSMVYHGSQVALTYEIPMSEVVLDFFDRLKSVSRGYASLDYGFKCFRREDLVRMDILIAGERVDALAVILHRSVAAARGRDIIARMKEVIPRQMFDIPIQAAIGAQVIARVTVKQMRKDVLAKCYGGDITRKRKLLEKQKAGKKRMKKLGKVDVPQEAFLAILTVGKDK